MNSNSFIWLFAIIFSSLASMLPNLWGEGMFSFSSIILGTLGGLLGIYVGFKISRY